MTRPWKLVALAAILAALCVYLMPNGPAAPRPAFAGDCTPANTGTLVIRIIDVSNGSPIQASGTQVLIKPDPRDFVLDDIVTDTALQDANTSQDKDATTGVIRFEGACSTQGSEVYTVLLWSLPVDLAECETKTDTGTTALAAGETRQVTLEVNCNGVGPTATVTPGPIAKVVTSASPLTVSCNGTSVISVSVLDAAGNPVKSGTAVTMTTTLGSLSPSSGFVTGSGGTLFAFFGAPASSGGVATITATAGSSSGSATVTVNCGAAAATATVAPPPTLVTGGSIIQPPNTGDGGLAAGAGTSRTWTVSGAVVLAMLILWTPFSLRARAHA